MVKKTYDVHVHVAYELKAVEVAESFASNVNSYFSLLELSVIINVINGALV